MRRICPGVAATGAQQRDLALALLDGQAHRARHDEDGDEERQPPNEAVTAIRAMRPSCASGDSALRGLSPVSTTAPAPAAGAQA
jgi:hypothetical protein